MIQKVGTVHSAGKMQDTITVIVHQQVSHPLYKKSFRQSKKFLVDQNGTSDIAVGDEVLIEECRPLSKRKHFRLKEVLKRVPRVSEIGEEKGLAEAMHRKQPESSAPSDSSAT